MLLSGLLSRIFQHEIDHLNGLVMWDDQLPQSLLDDLPEGVRITPRRLDRKFNLKELESDEAMGKFYQEN